MTDCLIVDPSKLFRPGRIIFSGGCSSLHCEILNLSSSGAKLGINKYSCLPRQFEFEIPDCGFRHGAELVWRDLDSIGIKFIESFALLPRAKSNMQEIIEENQQLRRNVELLAGRLTSLGLDVNALLSKTA